MSILPPLLRLPHSIWLMFDSTLVANTWICLPLQMLHWTLPPLFPLLLPTKRMESMVKSLVWASLVTHPFAWSLLPSTTSNTYVHMVHFLILHSPFTLKMEHGTESPPLTLPASYVLLLPLWVPPISVLPYMIFLPSVSMPQVPWPWFAPMLTPT